MALPRPSGTATGSRLRLDPAALSHEPSALGRYLDLWRHARATDSVHLLARLQARGLDRHILIVDHDARTGEFVFRYFGAGLAFVDAHARAALIGVSPWAFGDTSTVRTAAEGWHAAMGADRPLAELVDMPRLDAAGRPLRAPFRRLVLPIPVNQRTTRIVVASELLQPASEN